MEEINKEVVRDIIGMDKVFKSLPKTQQDIVIYRGGSSTNKSKEIGSENEWESPISFTTNKDIIKVFEKGVTYRSVLKAGSPAILIDILEKINWYGGSENELILPPLLYQVRDARNKQQENGVDLDIEILEFKDICYAIENSMKKYQERTYQKLTQVEKSETKLKMMDSEQEDEIFRSLGYDENDLQEKQLDIRDVIKKLEEKGRLKEFLEKDSEIERDNLQYQSDLHGTNHTRRVAFFATILSNLGELDSKDEAVLMAAVQYHDIGRKNDYEDKQHGTSSVKKLEENSDRLQAFDKEDQELIKFMMEQHSKSKKENEEAIARLDDEKKERYENLLNYMKDSDKLDRVRLGKYDGLDVSRLSLPTSKSLVRVAYQTHEYLFDIINVKNKDTYLNNSAKIEECLDLIDKEKDKPIENIEVEGLTYFDDEEKEIQNEEIIESKVEEQQEQNMENGLQKDGNQEEKWLNRFKGWYGAIDRVSEKSKAYFVKMKSDIIKEISNKTRERANDKQVYKGEEL